MEAVAGMEATAGAVVAVAAVVAMQAEGHHHKEGRADTVAAVAGPRTAEGREAVEVEVATGPSRRVAAGTAAVQAEAAGTAVAVPRPPAVAGGTAVTHTLSPAQAVVVAVAAARGTRNLRLPRGVVLREVAPASAHWPMTGASGRAPQEDGDNTSLSL